MGGFFLNLMPQMKALYVGYCSNHPSAVNLLTQHRYVYTSTTFSFILQCLHAVVHKEEEEGFSGKQLFITACVSNGKWDCLYCWNLFYSCSYPLFAGCGSYRRSSLRTQSAYSAVSLSLPTQLNTAEGERMKETFVRRLKANYSEDREVEVQIFNPIGNRDV